MAPFAKLCRQVKFGGTPLSPSSQPKKSSRCCVSQNGQLQNCTAQGYAGAWPAIVACYRLTNPSEVGRSTPGAPMLLVGCHVWGGDQPQAPMAAKAGGLLGIVPASPNFIMVGGPCRQKQVFYCTVASGLVTKQLGVGGPCRQICSQNNWHMGFCRQLLPRVQKLKTTQPVILSQHPRYCSSLSRLSSSLSTYLEIKFVKEILLEAGAGKLAAPCRCSIIVRCRTASM
jgi:hypothetical protein